MRGEGQSWNRGRGRMMGRDCLKNRLNMLLREMTLDGDVMSGNMKVGG